MYSGNPFFERCFPLVWVHKVLNFHLLEFARSEDKITRRNLITKRRWGEASTDAAEAHA